MYIWLFAVLFSSFLVFGLIGVRFFKPISVVCGFLLFALGAYMGYSNTITVSYYYYTTNSTWLSNTTTLPFTPWPQVIICLTGVMLILASSYGFKEG